MWEDCGMEEEQLLIVVVVVVVIVFFFLFFPVVMRLKTCGFYSTRIVCGRVYIVLFCATGGGALA
jgi:hypothetical protein